MSHLAGPGELMPVAVDIWRDAVTQRLRAGARVVTHYGRRVADGPDAAVVVTTVLEDGNADGGAALSVARTRVGVEAGYHSLTVEFPALHCFERELHEQTKVRVAGHPWLKPIRYEGKDQDAMRSFPFYRVDGKEVHEVAVGPVHAGVIEPGSFRFMCSGEQVHHLEIQLGYQHRGVEALLVAGNARAKGALVETIAGDSSVAYAWAHAAALERLSGCVVPAETEALRGMALELERIGMHLASLSGLAADVGHLQGGSTYGRLRTTAINTTMRLCGSRFGRGAVRPGGVGMSVPADVRKELEANVRLLQNDVAIMNRAFLSAASVAHRLRGVGVVAPEIAASMGLVGPAARASGSAVDARGARGIYAAVPMARALERDGDCWARARVRIAEIDASLAWISLALERYGCADRPRGDVGALAQESLAVTVVEGWRGEVVHCVETDATGAVLHYKVQDPSLRNWFGLALALRDNEISDFPVCNKSFDLSYAGNDL